MPFKRLVRSLPLPQAELLKQRLVEEWRSPQDRFGAPVIIEEGGGPFDPIKLYVIWEDWRGLTQIQRSEILMDVYESLHDSERATKVSVAMGLTSDEAKRLGISYQ